MFEVDIKKNMMDGQTEDGGWNGLVLGVGIVTPVNTSDYNCGSCLVLIPAERERSTTQVTMAALQSTVQTMPVQYSTVSYSTVPYNAVQYSTDGMYQIT